MSTGQPCEPQSRRPTVELSPHSSKDKCHKRRLAGLQGTREGLCVGLDSMPSKKLYGWGRGRRAESRADTGYWGCHSRYCKVKSTQLVTFYCDQELLKLSWQLPHTVPFCERRVKGKICHAPRRRTGQQFLLEHFQAEICCPKMDCLLFPGVTKSVQAPGLLYFTQNAERSRASLGSHGPSHRPDELCFPR